MVTRLIILKIHCVQHRRYETANGSDASGITCAENQRLAGDTGAVLIHGHDLKSVEVTTREGAKVTGEVRCLAGGVAMIAVGCHCILYSTQTGSP